MTLLAKKTIGLGLLLVGGLTAAHGGSAGQTWEIVTGLSLAAIGALLLAAKIVHRNAGPQRTGH
jgi:hypothetical protein